MSNSALYRSLSRHPLFASLFELKGNSKYCVLTEPLWGVPYNLYAPFVAVYMYALGLKDVQIGLIISVSLFCQVFTALLGGIATDKLGRKRTTFIFDIIAWSIPCLLWCFAQNFWWFFIAAVINSCWQVTGNSWGCLLVEDAPRSKMNHIYSWIYIGGRLSVFFAPISGLLLRNNDVVPIVRGLYFFAFLSMTAKFVILYIYSTETKQGLIKMEEVKNTSVFQMLAGYKDVFLNIIRMPHTRKLLMLIILTNIMSAVLENFFGLYVSQNLGLPSQYLAYFPILRAGIMMTFLFAIQPLLDRFTHKIPMLAGLAIYVVCHVVLILTPPQNVTMLIIYVVLEATGFALVMPRKDALLALNINPESRASIMSIMYVVMLAVSSPFGYIAGVLSNMDRRLPFLFNILLFAGMALIITTFKEMPGSGEEETEPLQEAEAV